MLRGTWMNSRPENEERSANQHPDEQNRGQIPQRRQADSRPGSGLDVILERHFFNLYGEGGSSHQPLSHSVNDLGLLSGCDDRRFTQAATK